MSVSSLVHPLSQPGHAAPHQQVIYPDPAALAQVMANLRAQPPLVSLETILNLRQDLTQVIAGNAVLLMAGLCVENMDQSPDQLQHYARGLTHMMQTVGHALQPDNTVIPVARMAGQMAKPRSEAFEKGTDILTYRGPLTHGFALDQRTPQASRLQDAHDFARTILDHTTGTGLYSSHEGLSLPYEDAHLRHSHGVMYTSSAPMIWIGNRTREMDGPHVAMARAIANPVGLKCGTDLTPDALQDLIETLNPDKTPGKLALIFRMGAGNTDALPDLLRVIKDYQDSTIAIVDPMHGNTVTDPATHRKTRHTDAITHEVRAFVAACRTADIHPGGVHLEASPAPVTECLGQGVTDLRQNYQTMCDPCLNPHQAQTVAGAFHQTMRAASGRIYALA